MKLDIELLNEFKSRVNANRLPLIKIFSNYNGKNKWNVICATMDWMTVAIDGIDTARLSRENNNDASIKMMTFCNCVDVMWESIQQLYRVLEDKTDIPFSEYKDVFFVDNSDNDQWKEIRSIFSAHPVNLHNIFAENDKTIRWFASWSGGTFSPEDFSVYLYPNQVGRSSELFSIRFEKIIAFIEKRYGYLNRAMQLIDQRIKEYNQQWKTTIINANHNDVFSWIDTLFEENKQRYNLDSIEYDLEQIRETFLAKACGKLNQKALAEYKTILISHLYHIEEYLQKMGEGMEYPEVRFNYPDKLLYPLAKAFAERDAMREWGIDVLTDDLMNFVNLDDSMTEKDVEVLIRAGLFKKYGLR